MEKPIIRACSQCGSRDLLWTLPAYQRPLSRWSYGPLTENLYCKRCGTGVFVIEFKSEKAYEKFAKAQLKHWKERLKAEPWDPFDNSTIVLPLLGKMKYTSYVRLSYFVTFLAFFLLFLLLLPSIVIGGVDVKWPLLLLVGGAVTFVLLNIKRNSITPMSEAKGRKTKPTARRKR
ncbi:MAG: hypothetical protein WC759_01715 [Candidatus Micrarchaeia archaeon]|jgi:hypothetical protein